MADKIDQLKIGSTSYDLDLPPDATPSIASLTTSGNVTAGGTVTANGVTLTGNTGTVTQVTVGTGLSVTNGTTTPKVMIASTHKLPTTTEWGQKQDVITVQSSTTLASTLDIFNTKRGTIYRYVSGELILTEQASYLYCGGGTENNVSGYYAIFLKYDVQGATAFSSATAKLYKVSWSLLNTTWGDINWSNCEINLKVKNPVADDDIANKQYVDNHTSANYTRSMEMIDEDDMDNLATYVKPGDIIYYVDDYVYTYCITGVYSRRLTFLTWSSDDVYGGITPGYMTWQEGETWGDRYEDITHLQCGTPSRDQDIANKSYVDNKVSKRLAPTTTTANKVLLSTINGDPVWSSWSTAGLLFTNSSGVVSSKPIYMYSFEIRGNKTDDKFYISAIGYSTTNHVSSSSTSISTVMTAWVDCFGTSDTACSGVLRSTYYSAELDVLAFRLSSATQSSATVGLCYAKPYSSTDSDLRATTSQAATNIYAAKVTKLKTFNS